MGKKKVNREGSKCCYKKRMTLCDCRNAYNRSGHKNRPELLVQRVKYPETTA